jgi:two-component system sensor histidine kinase BaeS
LRISIGHRLFVSVLLAILAVAATGILLMRQNVLRSFSEYAANIELDRLEELSVALAQHYRSGAGWSFLPAGEMGRRRWIVDELARLQTSRLAQAAPAACSSCAPRSRRLSAAGDTVGWAPRAHADARTAHTSAWARGAHPTD